MSNKIQLQTNNTALDEYIVRINAAKEVAAGLPKAGGGSGDGSVKTCTLTLDNMGTSVATNIIVSKLIDDVVTVESMVFFPESIEVIPDVVCGSLFNILTAFNEQLPDAVAINISGSAEMLYNDARFLFKAPNVAGENCTITLTHIGLD